MDAERLTVQLIPKASYALVALMADLGLSETDAVNRALQVYAFIREHEQRGETLAFMDPDTNTGATYTLDSP